MATAEQRDDTIDVPLEAFHGRVMRAAVQRVTSVLYSVEKELKESRPLVAAVVGDAAFELDNAQIEGAAAAMWGEVLAGGSEDEIIGKHVGCAPQVKGEVKIAEIVVRRREIETGLEALDSVSDMTAEQRGEFEELLTASAELDGATLRAIKDGKVDPLKAAQAACGSEVVG